MGKDIDLLPWILGALTMAIVAAAIAVGTMHGPAPAALQIPSHSPAPILPAVAAIETAPSPPIVESAMPSEQTQPASAPPLQSGQIWECTIDGLRTFSSKPCGDKATLRDVGPVNVMNATPVAQPSRAYPGDGNFAPDYSYPEPQESADNSYPAVIGIPYAVRMRPERPRHPNGHDHGVPPQGGAPHGVPPHGVLPRGVPRRN
jgi:hypothetical protein